MAKEIPVTLNIDIHLWDTLVPNYRCCLHHFGKEWRPFPLPYIGQTGDLSKRFDDHHKRPRFDRIGKTYIGIHLESSESRRCDIGTDLVRHCPRSATTEE